MTIIQASYFIILIIIMVLFSIFTFGIKDGRNLTILEKSIKDSCLFVGKIVSAPFDFIDKKIEETKEKKNIYEKYKKMQKKYEKTSVSMPIASTNSDSPEY